MVELRVARGKDHLSDDESAANLNELIRAARSLGVERVPESAGLFTIME